MVDLILVQVSTQTCMIAKSAENLLYQQWRRGFFGKYTVLKQEPWGVWVTPQATIPSGYHVPLLQTASATFVNLCTSMYLSAGNVCEGAAPVCQQICEPACLKQSWFTLLLEYMMLHMHMHMHMHLPID